MTDPSTLDNFTRDNLRRLREYTEQERHQQRVEQHRIERRDSIAEQQIEQSRQTEGEDTP